MEERYVCRGQVGVFLVVIAWLLLALMLSGCATIFTDRQYNDAGILRETGMAFSLASKDAARFQMKRSDKQDGDKSEIVEEAGAQQETSPDVEFIKEVLSLYLATKGLASAAP